jgi:hypothetical protein
LHSKSKLQPHRQGPASSPIGIELAGECLREQDHDMADEDIPEKVDLAFLARQGKQILAELAAVRGDLKAFREDVAATDAENAKILETITHDIADLKTIFVDLQARVVRDEKRIKSLEKARPDA